MKNKITLVIATIFLISCKSQTKEVDKVITTVSEETPVIVENQEAKEDIVVMNTKLDEIIEKPIVVKETMIKEMVKDAKVKAIIEKPIAVVKESMVKEEAVVKEVVVDTNLDATIKESTTVKESIVKETIPVDKVLFDHSNFDQLLKKQVTKDGKVNYAAIKKDKETLSTYITNLNSNAPNDTWSKNDKFAYYMNAYNAMTIDLIISNYPTKSIKDIKDPWEQHNWKLDGKSVSLNEIEHEILRKMNDPRIHIGINCASFSCPPLLNEAFTAEKVQQQLEKLAIQFVNDPKRNKITKDRVEVSKIFRWFKGDFTKNGDLIDFLNKYSNIAIDEDARVRYMDYNWELNE
jgi:hypothetical protein